MKTLSIRFVRFRGMPLLDQLKYEEKLLRHNHDNWCIVADGPIRPTIVLGLSGKVEKLVNVEAVYKDNISMIRRFSGGGTVVVDKSTIFVTLIINASSSNINCQPYPREIMKWTGDLYKPIFQSFATNNNFALRENDYVFDDKKIGGNAQSIVKSRWLHHTSFLWDFSSKSMQYLQIPEKRPEYRGTRNHLEFLTPIKNHVPPSTTPLDFIHATKEQLHSHFETVETVEVSSLLRELEGEQYQEFQPRTTIEPIEKYLQGHEVKPSPSLVRSGPSCFNI